MISTKQRAWLRSQANPLSCGFQIGKGEISAQVLQSLDETLSTHELLKINVMKAYEGDLHALASELALASAADVVQVIGRRITLYRHSEKLAKLERDMKFPRNI